VSERESVYMCVYVCEREGLCMRVCMGVRERQREIESVCSLSKHA